MPGRRRRRSPVDETEKSKKAKMSVKSPNLCTKRYLFPQNSDIGTPYLKFILLKRDSSNTFSSKTCTMWFREYTNTDENLMGPEGMEKFCEDIGVEPENVIMLSLAWKLGAKSMGFFRLEEWMKGMTELQCDSVAKLQAKFEYLRSLLTDSSTFKNIFRFAFDFARDQNQRSLDIDTAKAMLSLLLGGNWSLYTSFHQFLELHQTKYKVINKDQWCNILEFSRSINPDLSNYDEDGAWPVMLDEFVEWLKEQGKTS